MTGVLRRQDNGFKKKKKKKLTSHFHSLDLEKKGRQLVPVQSATLSLATEGKVMTKD